MPPAITEIGLAAFRLCLKHQIPFARRRDETMKRFFTWKITISAVLVLFAATALMAGGNHFLRSGEGEKVSLDLNDLYDGETRVFGEGDHQLTATRKGDVVSLHRAAGSEKQALDFECQLDTDVCTILTGEDSDRTMVMVRRVAECADGEDCKQIEHNISLLGDAGAGMARQVMVMSAGGCAGEEECARVHEMHEGAVWVSADGDHNVLPIGDGANVFTILKGGHKFMLTCPEGDTTMRVDKDEAEDTFLCPRHSVPLEKLSRPEGLHEIILELATEDD
jgi:hypothetical protein